MEKLTICTWLWGNKYTASYVLKLATAVRRNLRQPCEFVCITNWPNAEELFLKHNIRIIGIEDPELLKVKGCVVRLRMFDPEWQQRHGLQGKIVNIDLDAVVVGNLDSVFNKDCSFAILQGINSSNPCPYNGSLFMFRAGEHANVWRDFSLAAFSQIPFHEFPDDQGWFHIKVPNAASFGPSDGVYGFKKPGWPSGDDLPSNARLVAFPGWRDPTYFKHLPWINQHWRE